MSLESGYIKLWRDLLKKPIWIKSTPEQRSVLISILLLANHSTTEWEWMGEKFKVNPGQFISSLESLRGKSGNGISTQNVRSSLKRFQKLEFLTDYPTNTGRIITIINWGSYQPEKINPTKEATKTQQRPNKDPTPNKNDKNNKNVKKEKKKIIKKSFSDYLQEKIIENNFIATKDKIFEFYKYRQAKPKAKQYQSEKGINGLFRDLNGCRDNGLIVSDCLEIAMEKGWQTPEPTYYKQNNNKNGFANKSEQNTQTCKEWANGE